MRKFSLSAVVSLLVAALAVAGLGLTAGPAAAADPTPTIQDTARLLGYMWGDGSQTDGVWDVNGPSGTSSLVEEVVEAHGGTWVDRPRLRFTLPAPYDWDDWKDGLPDDSAWVRSAVENHNFVAALLETEGSIFGQIYDQSRCCVPGFTQGRLTELRDLMQRQGFSSAELVQFGNIDSGRVQIDSSEFRELRGKYKFACPASNDSIRIPGDTDLAAYGNLRWIQPGERWSDVVRSDCPVGSAVQAPTAQAGSCSVSAVGNQVTVDWTFTLGDAVMRRDGGFVSTTAGRDQTWSESRPDGQYSYQIRLIAFGITTQVECGTVNVGDGTPPPVAGPCSVSAAGSQVTVAWDDFGKNQYVVRKNGRWVATVTGARSTTLAGTTADAWVLRFNDGGERVDIPCGEGDTPPVDGPCQIAGRNGAVEVSWDSVPGVSSYQVRRDGRWTATVTNTTSFTDANGTTGDSYVIRYRTNGVRVDIPCA